MAFKVTEAINEANESAKTYLTKNLSDVDAGIAVFNELVSELGGAIYNFPKWHPILSIPEQSDEYKDYSVSGTPLYYGCDHTVYFASGFVTCPYVEQRAKNLVEKINKVNGLYAYQLKEKLYSDMAYPIVVGAIDVKLEADGTIRSRDALAWCVQYLAKDAHQAQVAETWWTMRSCILGEPSGARSSILVNQHTGNQMKKILETLNDSGMYGEIKECSLEMLSEKKRKKISETLIMAAFSKFNGEDEDFEFLLRDETCKANVVNLAEFGDEPEYHIWVVVGNHDLNTSGFYYPETKVVETSDPRGKKALALKFL